MSSRYARSIVLVPIPADHDRHCCLRGCGRPAVYELTVDLRHHTDWMEFCAPCLVEIQQKIAGLNIPQF